MYMWPVVLFLLLRVWFYQQWPDFPKAFSTFIEYPGWGLWVLWLLVWFNAFVDVSLLVSYFLPKWKKMIVSITLVIAYVILIILREHNNIPSYHFIGYDYFISYTPIFLVGYLLGDKPFTYINKWISIIVGSLGLVMVVVLCRFATPFYSSGYHIEENLGIFYAATVCAVGFYYGISTLISRIKIGEVIGVLGQFTLECYFLHLVLLKNWSAIRLENAWLTTIASIALVILCLGNTVLVVATYFNPFLHFLLFGRHFSYYKFENKAFDKLRDFCLNFKNKNNSNNISNITE